MQYLLQSPWLSAKRAPSGRAATRRVAIDISGWIGPDWYKIEEGDRQNTREALAKELSDLGTLDADEIYVTISSPGGDVHHALGIHDVLAAHGARVTTDVHGMSASSATIIAQAGAVRRMSQAALYLIHDVAQFVFGGMRISDLEELISDQRTVNAHLADLYARRSGFDAAAITDLMHVSNGRGRWLRPTEAMEFGLVDETYEPRAAAASIIVPAGFADIAHRLGLPELPEGWAPQHTPDQTPHPVTDGQTAPQQDDTEEQTLMLTKDQIANLEARFGAAFALAAVTSDTEYLDALSAGSDQLVTRIGELQADIVARDERITTLEAENAGLKTRTQGLTDPLAADETPEAPPADPPAPDPLPIADAHAVLVAAGKSKSEAWAQLRNERPAEYVEHFSKG